MAQKKVLIVEDVFLNSEFLRIWVKALGYDVCGIARTAKQAAQLAVEHCPHIILMDLRLEGERDGVDAALEIEKTLESVIIFVTASEDKASLDRIMTVDPFRVLFKPVEPTELVDALQAAALAAPDPGGDCTPDEVRGAA